MDRDYIKRTSDQLDVQELEYLERRYASSQVYKGLGLTRDTLRYYEELGILSPEKNEENSYREYSIIDIMNILAIDFYKKRGITPKELKRAKEENPQGDFNDLFRAKQKQLQEEIKYQKRILKKLEETMAFTEGAEQKLNVFEVKEFPLYEVVEEFSSITNFKEYGNLVLKHIDTSEDDIVSNMIKTLMFDDNGYTGSKGYFVKQVKSKKNGHQYLEQGPALCVAMEDLEDEGEYLMEEMYVKCFEWAKKHGKTFKGAAYLQPKCISWMESGLKNYLECWVPLES